MSGNVVAFTSTQLQRPEDPEWIETIAFTPFVVIGVDKVAGADTFIVWQQVLEQVDCVVCPSKDVAVALLSHLFTEIFYSAALDNIGPDIFNPEGAAYQLRQVLKRLKPFAAILEGSGFRHVDSVINHRKHAAAMVLHEERSRRDDEEFKARIAKMATNGLPEVASM